MADHLLGIDFGTDSCRALIVNAGTGEEAAAAVARYPRWAGGLYCDAALARFRQHPLDHIESMEQAVREAAALAGPEIAGSVRGIGVDTTGSTTCAVDGRGVPLSLKPEFAENPSAMFVLWKDHSAAAEADLINLVARSGGFPDYLKFSGGSYSSEWFWARVLRVLNEDPAVAAAAVSFLEHCEWIPALLGGIRDLGGIKRSRCTAGHKGLWRPRFDPEHSGYPPRGFFEAVDPRLGPVYQTLGTESWPGDTPAGRLCAEWAGRLGLPRGIPIAVGAVDAHVGAVGGGAAPGRMVMVVGTSTCEMIVGPRPLGPEKPIRGICGQVDGSIVPGMIGYEAGQSAFGDVYAWFRDLLLWPLETLLPGAEAGSLSPRIKEDLKEEIAKKLLPRIEAEAEKLEPSENAPLALDWFNGRRSPDVSALVKGALTGLGLGTGAVKLYRALVEATAFGARAIVRRFREEGIAIEGVYAVGGVARKSSLVMQTLADVLDMPIQVRKSDQAVALGAAMFAAVVSGIYPDIPAAQKALCPVIEKTYSPNPARRKIYDALYDRYRALGNFEETRRIC
ncbi:MAG: ribulokinase [Treponema sp.]|jgi:L-ribulokinase|nr:ribulokinase [Treponema sp.]